jgi:hypothetical protein
MSSGNPGFLGITPEMGDITHNSGDTPKSGDPAGRPILG